MLMIMMIFHCDFSTGNACAKIILENCVVTQELKIFFNARRRGWQRELNFETIIVDCDIIKFNETSAINKGLALDAIRHLISLINLDSQGHRRREISSDFIKNNLALGCNKFSSQFYFKLFFFLLKFYN